MTDRDNPTDVIQDELRENIARVVKGARLSAAFGREFRAGDGRLDDVDLDAADAILALQAAQHRQEDVAMRELAKANNTLARMNGEHRDEWRAKAVAYADVLDRIVADFEMDFVLDGVVVDDPARLLVMNWQLARAALERNQTDGGERG